MDTVKEEAKKYSEGLHIIDKHIGYNSFLKGVNYILKNQWINCSNYLPEIGERVIVMLNNDNVDFAIFLIIKDEKLFYMNNKHYKVNKDISYWMSIPKSPLDLSWDYI